MTCAESILTAARTLLVLDQPFFGTLLLRLRLLSDPSCETAWTDGRTLGYNPEYIKQLTQPQLIGLLCHEVLHCAAGHPWRRDGRDPRQWNIACDLAINPIVADAGLQLPAGSLQDAQYAGRSAEWIYARLPQPQPQQQQPQPAPAGGGNGQPQPAPAGGTDQQQPQPQQPQPQQQPQRQPQRQPQPQQQPAPAGEVRDAPAAAADDQQTESEWQQAVQQAATAAQAHGQLSAGLRRYARQLVAPRTDWRSALRRYVQQYAASDYSWQVPNARYLYRGLYLPALRAQTCGPLAVCIDTSGSIDDQTLRQFASEIVAIADDVRPSAVHLVWCDAEVHRIDTFAAGEPITFDPAGGGGTDFRPAFRAIADMDDQPVCCVYLTDLYGTFPDAAPDVPVLWAATSDAAVPFGDVVRLNT